MFSPHFQSGTAEEAVMGLDTGDGAARGDKCVAIVSLSAVKDNDKGSRNAARASLWRMDSM